METNMNEMVTPVRVKAVSKLSQERKDFIVPETPALKQLGYGTGVGVYHMSPTIAGGRSPWAIKKVLSTHKHSTFGKLLKDEARLLRTLNHPNIIGFRGFKVLEDGRNVLAMEECSQSLGDMLEQRLSESLGPFPSNTILKVASNIAEALRYLHDDVKILHGDIKSFNILVNGDFEAVKLCDFGVSLQLDENGKAIGEYVGTRCWSAPEALLNENITSKSDIFPFGLTLWEMISLWPPHMLDMSSMDDSFDFEESQEFEDKYGTRPELPLNNLGDDYNLVIRIFEMCTEENYLKRPDAKDILSLL